MKKIILVICLFSVSMFLFAQKLSVTNLLGGDKYETAYGDVFSFFKDVDGNIKYNSRPLISDRFQVDAKSKFMDARIRTDVGLLKNAKYDMAFSLKGYGMCFPIPYVAFGAGNSFFQKYSLKGAWLGACDDSPKTGRLIKEGAAIYVRIPFDKAGDLKASVSISPELWNVDESTASSENSFYYNCGFEYEYPEIISFGVVFQNIKDKSFRYGIYTGTNFFEGFYINAGFVYNFRDSDFLPFSVNSKNDTDSFNTEYAFVFSTGYENESYNFGIFADCVSGGNNYYVKKSGKTGYYKDNEIPLFSALRINYKVMNDLLLEVQGKFSLMIPAATYFHSEIYGGVEYKISKQAGSVKAGVRLNTDKSRVTVFSFPILWKYKLSEK